MSSDRHIAEDDAAARAALSSTPNFRAWRDVWYHRFERDSPQAALGPVWGIGVIAFFVVGLAIAILSATDAGVVIGLLMVMLALGAAEHRKYATLNAGFLWCTSYRPSPEKTRSLRDDWCVYLAAVAKPSGVLPWRRTVSVGGMWMLNLPLAAIVLGPAVMNWWIVGPGNAGGLTRSRLLLLIAAVLVSRIVASHISRRRIRLLTEACSGDSCAWCGHGLPRAIEEIGVDDRCPECGTPNPAAPPALLSPHL